MGTAVAERSTQLIQAGQPSGRPLRIAFATETWHPYVDGIVMRLTMTIRELRARGHEILVIAPHSGPEMAGGAELLPDDVEVHRVPSIGLSMVYGGKRWGLPLPQIGRRLVKFNPDVVHAVNPFMLCRAAIRSAGRKRWPLVCSYHTHLADYARAYSYGFAENAIWRSLRRLHGAAEINLAASSAARGEMEKHGIPRVHVWDGAVDVSMFSPKLASPAMRERLTRGNGGRTVVTYVGRLSPEKSIDRLLPLVWARSDVHLVLIGDGPARVDLEQRFNGTNTTFMGWLSRPIVAEALASSDVFAFPSTTDTLGLAVLEAMASGLPALVADSQNGRDLVAGTTAGAVFDPSDPGAVVRALDQVMGAPRSRRDLAASARRRFPTWQQATDQLLGYYWALGGVEARAA